MTPVKSKCCANRQDRAENAAFKHGLSCILKTLKESAKNGVRWKGRAVKNQKAAAESVKSSLQGDMIGGNRLISKWFVKRADIGALWGKKPQQLIGSRS